MKQQYENAYLYFILIYIVKLTHNEEYIFLYLIVEMEISRVANPNFMIHQFQFLTNVLLKTILLNEISFRSGQTTIG